MIEPSREKGEDWRYLLIVNGLENILSSMSQTACEGSTLVGGSARFAKWRAAKMYGFKGDSFHTGNLPHNGGIGHGFFARHQHTLEWSQLPDLGWCHRFRYEENTGFPSERQQQFGLTRHYF
jgi:hypothetical protein